jgi:hypothetical protein
MKKNYFIALALLISNFAIAQIGNGLILHYQCNGNALDNTINNLDGTNTGAVGTMDRFSTANSSLYFNGVDARVQLLNNNAVKATFPITVGFWLKTDLSSSVQQPIFVSDVASDNYYGYWIVLQPDLTIQASIGSGGILTSSGRRTKISATGVTLNTWNHITVVYRSGVDMDIYVNCVNAGGSYSGTAPTTVGYSASPTFLCFNETSASIAYTKAYLDDFAIWNRELTLSEIQSLCNNSLGIKEELILSNNNFELYPNPSNGSINITSTSILTSILVHDSQGKEISSDNISFDNNLKPISINGLLSGTYFITVSFADGTSSVKKAVIID